jgi:spore maturation protein CgeB
LKIAIFCHSIVSDWNHGNAHFLRGVASELIARGHRVGLYEPRDGWSLSNLTAEHGTGPIERFHRAYPQLTSVRYDIQTLDLARELDGADLVLVHEWNEPELIARVGEHRRRTRSFRLLFHDTHHRAVSDPAAIERLDLRDYDGVLAFGRILRQIYLERGWAQRAWCWHEAADVRVFKPINACPRDQDLVWIGNWGDQERSGALREFLIYPTRELRLSAAIYGVRYPRQACRELRDARLDYRGWLANFEAPSVFAGFKATVHVPRSFYVDKLPGIPTIRVFEALACGIPLISAPWEDAEGLFDIGSDFLMARDGRDMKRKLRMLTRDAVMAAELAARGLKTIRERHTCAHRVDELLDIYSELLPHPGREARVKHETVNP